MPQPSSPEHRRVEERYLAFVPTAVTRADSKQRPAMIRDMSRSGALLLIATTKIVVGEHVTLDLFIADDTSTRRTTRATVVRVEELKGAERGLWSRKIAVKFDDLLTIDATEEASIRQRAAKFGMTSN